MRAKSRSDSEGFISRIPVVVESGLSKYLVQNRADVICVIDCRNLFLQLLMTFFVCRE